MSAVSVVLFGHEIVHKVVHFLVDSTLRASRKRHTWTRSRGYIILLDDGTLVFTANVTVNILSETQAPARTTCGSFQQQRQQKQCNTVTALSLMHHDDGYGAIAQSTLETLLLLLLGVVSRVCQNCFNLKYNNNIKCTSIITSLSERVFVVKKNFTPIR